MKKDVAPLVGGPPGWLKKRTMIKDLIGCPRRTSYALPVPAHVYGKAEVKDTEGCGMVMSSWAVSVPSKPKESQRSFVKTNKFALRDGCIDAKSQRHYAVDHPDIRFKEPTGKLQGAQFEPPFKGPYGMATESEQECVQSLIEADYTPWADDVLDYPDLSALEKKRRLKPPKATKASQGHDIRTKPETILKEPFKMKRFANVQARIALPQ